MPETDSEALLVCETWRRSSRLLAHADVDGLLRGLKRFMALRADSPSAVTLFRPRRPEACP